MKKTTTLLITVLAMIGVPNSGDAQATAPVAPEFALDTLTTGLDRPVAMAFLPDGRALLAQRSIGALEWVDPDTGARTPVSGLPTIYGEGDAGLLDVLPHPAYGDNGWIYLAYTRVVADSAYTALDRVRITGSAVTEREELFVARPGTGDDTHFAGRLAFIDEHVFMSIGDRYVLEEAQSLQSYNGTIVRLRDDGSLPDDNPFVAVPGALPEIWSYGHRNPQGMAVNPVTGSLWANEHGPQGGDEVNVVHPGRNYGWPVVTYGEEYGGGPIGEGITRRPGMEEPIHLFLPSIGPSDMVFLTRGVFPGWDRSVLVGAMAQLHLSRLTYAGDQVIHEQRLLGEHAWRVRMVEEGPDGSIYVGTDSGLLVRIRPPTP